MAGGVMGREDYRLGSGQPSATPALAPERNAGASVSCQLPASLSGGPSPQARDRSRRARPMRRSLAVLGITSKEGVIAQAAWLVRLDSDRLFRGDERNRQVPGGWWMPF